MRYYKRKILTELEPLHVGDRVRVVACSNYMFIGRTDVVDDVGVYENTSKTQESKPYRLRYKLRYTDCLRSFSREELEKLEDQA